MNKCTKYLFSTPTVQTGVTITFNIKHPALPQALADLISEGVSEILEKLCDSCDTYASDLCVSVVAESSEKPSG